MKDVDILLNGIVLSYKLGMICPFELKNKFIYNSNETNKQDRAPSNVSNSVGRIANNNFRIFGR